MRRRDSVPLQLALLLCCCLCCCLLPTCVLPAHAAPRAVNTEPVYRPVYSPSAYHTYASYQAELDSLLADARHAPALLRELRSPERTFAGEQLRMMRVRRWEDEEDEEDDTSAAGDTSAASTASPDSPAAAAAASPRRRLRLLLSFGEHARELVTVESFFHLLRWVLEGHASAEEDCAVLGEVADEFGSALTPDASGATVASSPGYRARFSRFLLSHVSLDLVGVTNPDGKAHLESSGEYCHRNTGRGVDLNRNADWEWGGPGSSDKEGDEEYRGTGPFSEAETRFLRDMQGEEGYDAYVSVHSGEQQLFVPFVDTVSKKTRRTRPSTAAELALMARVVSSPRLGGWLHDSGVGWAMNDYSADGTLFDWMAGKAGVETVYCVELWGGPTHKDCFVQFNPSSDEIVVAGRKTSLLQQDLRRMHVFFIELLREIIADKLGVAYRDPLEVDDMAERGRRLAAEIKLCEAEKILRAEQRRLRNKEGAVQT